MIAKNKVLFFREISYNRDMPPPTKPKLEPGRVYRTRELARWGKNPSRLARRLEREGRLHRLAGGLFVHPRQSRFGSVPPDEKELLRGFLDGGPFVVTGPERWNALGLGATALFRGSLVYNTKRSGEFTLGGPRYFFRRVRFPTHSTPEWYVVDLLENHQMAGVSLGDLEAALTRAIQAGRFQSERLAETAKEYGTLKTRLLVERLVRTSESSP